MVKVYSRSEIEGMMNNGEQFTNDFILSFYDVGCEPVDYSKILGEVLLLEVDDISFDELEEEGYSYESYFPNALYVAEKINHAVKNGKSIICQCEYGMSRSAGCAAAILEFYEGHGIEFFVDYSKCPSQLVYHKIYDGLVSCNM